jgi:hypothetical protein
MRKKNPEVNNIDNLYFSFIYVLGAYIGKSKITRTNSEALIEIIQTIQKA